MSGSSLTEVNTVCTSKAVTELNPGGGFLLSADDPVRSGSLVNGLRPLSKFDRSEGPPQLAASFNSAQAALCWNWGCATHPNNER
jgi:hypothetical protein